MRKIYCGGAFNFDYLNDGYREYAEMDYRAMILGGASLLLERNECVKINENVEYIGPFYFETDGMKDHDIVQSGEYARKTGTYILYTQSRRGRDGKRLAHSLLVPDNPQPYGKCKYLYIRV